MTVPVVLVAALLIGHAGDSGGGSSTPSQPAVLAPITVAAPPSPDATTTTDCAEVLEVLPTQLGALKPRVVRSSPSSAFVVGWGQPPVVLRCGVARPAGLKVDSAALTLVLNGVDFWHTATKTEDVYTVVDRAVYIEVTVPTADASGPVTLLATAVAKALPAVCLPTAASGQPQPDPAQLCTHRP